MKCLAGCFCAFAAAVRFLSVADATEAKSTAPEDARKTPGASGNGKPDDAIRQLRVAAPCTLTEIAVTELGGGA